jgi:hypothetical protein
MKEGEEKIRPREDIGKERTTENLPMGIRRIN